jgi:hypothetical protein
MLSSFPIPTKMSSRDCNISSARDKPGVLILSGPSDLCLSRAETHADLALRSDNPRGCHRMTRDDAEELEERLVNSWAEIISTIWRTLLLQHAKQAELQSLSDSSLALGHSSSQSLLFVSSMITWTRLLPNKCQISNFIMDTYRTLGSSLKTESKDLIGHVNALQRHIMASPSTTEVRPVVRLGSVLYGTSDLVRVFSTPSPWMSLIIRSRVSMAFYRLSNHAYNKVNFATIFQGASDYHNSIQFTNRNSLLARHPCTMCLLPRRTPN